MHLVVAAGIDEQRRAESSACSAFSGVAATVPYLRSIPSPGMESTRLWAS